METLFALFGKLKVLIGGAIAGFIGVLLILLKWKNHEIRKQEIKIANINVEKEKLVDDAKAVQTEKTIAEKLNELSKEKERKTQKIREKKDEKPKTIHFGVWHNN